MTDYPKKEDIPPERWARMNISEEDYTARRERRLKREENAPAVGDAAPDFEAERLSPEGHRTGDMLQLSSLRGKPAALVFGSYT